MWEQADSRLYHWEFLVAGIAIAFEAFITLVYWPATEYWWLAVATAAGTAVLWMGADRSRYGEWVVYTVGGVLIVALLAGVPALVHGSRMFGLGVWMGIGLNRFVFGVLRPMPEYRRTKRAERAAAG